MNNATDCLGYFASLLVLATFCMRDMRRLRLLAIASNFAFIGYGLLAGIGPVLLLHLVLLPVNLLRWWQSSRPAVSRCRAPFIWRKWSGPCSRAAPKKAEPEGAARIAQ